VANNKADLNTSSVPALKDDTLLMSSTHPDSESREFQRMIDSVREMPIEDVKKELERLGFDFKEILPDCISRHISARACQCGSTQNVTSEPAAFPKVPPSKFIRLFLRPRLRLEWALKPVVFRPALFVIGVLCATVILFLVTDLPTWLPKAQDESKKIYVKISDDDLLSIKARDNLKGALEASQRVRIAENPKDADAILNLFVKQNVEDKARGTKAADSQTVSIRVQFINNGSNREWPTNESFDMSYIGPINEITPRIMDDLLRNIQSSAYR
jgi:hypothetical protein